MGRRCWLDLFTGTTWEEFLGAGASVSGFRKRRWASVQRISVGDWLLCYVTGVSRWIGILEVTGKPYLSDDKIWADDVFPARLPVKLVLQLTPANAVPVTSLRDKLSYFQGENSRGWGGHFRASPGPVSAEDAAVIVAAMEEAAADPAPRPVNQGQWNRRLRLIEAPNEDEVIVPDQAEDEPPSGEQEEPTETVSHEGIQWLLLKLGSEMGFDVWLARNDRGRSYNGRPLADMPRVRDSLPAQFDPATNRTIELIDVLWLDGPAITAAFEVEHTTAIYSGLLRMADLVSMQPGITIPLYIVAPDDRREKVLTEISRPVFSRMKPPLRDRCRFIAYSELKAREEQLRGFTQFLKPEFLEEISEPAP